MSLPINHSPLQISPFTDHGQHHDTGLPDLVEDAVPIHWQLPDGVVAEPEEVGLLSKNFAGALLIVLSSTLAAGEEEKRDRVIEYFQLNGMMAMIERNSKLGVQEIRRQNPGLDPAFWDSDEFRAAIDWWEKAFLEANVSVAMKYISDEELEELFAFLNTDTGQKFVSSNLRLQPLYDEANAAVFGVFNDVLNNAIQEFRQKPRSGHSDS